MIDRIIRFVYYSLFFITPLLVNPSTSELFEFNKMMFIYFSTIVVFLLWILKSVREKKIILRRTVFDLPLLVLFTSQFLSTVFSIDRHTSFFGYYGRFNGGLLSLLAYLVLFYGFVNFMQKESLLKLLKISLVSAFIVILWGLPGRLGFDLSCGVFTGKFTNSCWTEQFRPHERMFSTLGQPNWLGAYLVINFFIVLYFYILLRYKKVSQDIKQKLMLPGFLFFITSAILFTRSRSSMVALGTCFFITTAILYFLETTKAKKELLLKKLVLPVFVIFVLATLLFQTGIPKVDKILRPLQNKKSETIKISTVPQVPSEVTESLDIRKIVWKGAIDLGLKYPIFGTGVETFAYSYYFVRPLSHNLTSEWDYLYNKAHNEFLNYLATTGFIGFLSYLFFIGFFLRWCIKTIFAKKGDDRILTVSLFGAWISILITNFFGFSTTSINLFFYLIPAVLLISNVAKKSKDIYIIEKKIAYNKKLINIGLSLMSVFLLGWLFFYYIADLDYASGTAYSQAGDYEKSSQLFNRALQLHYEHVYEDKLSYALANLAVVAAYQKESSTAAELIKLSELHNTKTLQKSSQNSLYWKTRSKNHYLYYQITLDKNYLTTAIEALNEDKRLSPTDPKIPYTIAIFYSLLADEENDQEIKPIYQRAALDYALQSISLKPNFRDGYFLQGQLLSKYGNKEEAKKAFEKALEISPNDREILEQLHGLEVDVTKKR